jgi:hypothetical protein
MDRLAPLLHRVTGASYEELARAISGLSAAERDRLNAIAGEITDDIRMIALEGRREARSRIVSG